MKRAFDLVVSSAAILLLSPVMLVVALLIRAQLGSPILFLHTRPGLHGRPFRLYKFRTMRAEAPTGDASIEDTIARLTPFTEKLRDWSLDELPSLFNVLQGHMSLVGPRPLEMKYLPLYNKEQARRHDVLPGITGWAQVNGRSAITWEDKFKLDVWYVDNQSLWLDVKIIILTALKVLHRSDTTPDAGKIMPNFQGGPDKNNPSQSD